MKSAVLNSPENISKLKEAREKRAATMSRINKQKNGKGKRQRQQQQSKKSVKMQKKKSSPSPPSTSSSDDQDDANEDIDFCIICMKNMPLKLSRHNSIECNTCKRAVHLNCANMRASFFTCPNCTSD